VSKNSRKILTVFWKTVEDSKSAPEIHFTHIVHIFGKFFNISIFRAHDNIVSLLTYLLTP